MATKKYLSLERLAEYDALLKAKIASDDESTLQSSKGYTDTEIGKIVDGTTTVAKASSATYAANAQSADQAESALLATKANSDGQGNVIADTYETKTDATAKLNASQSYTDDEIQKIKDGLYVAKNATNADNAINADNADNATWATNATNAFKATNDEQGNNIATTYETKSNASTQYDTLSHRIDVVNTAVERLTNGVNADEIDSVNDLIEYVNTHGAEVVAMQEGIAQNASDIDDVAGRVDTLEASIGESGSIANDIATAKAEAIAAADINSSNKDAVVLAEAQKGIAAVQILFDDCSDRIDTLEEKVGDGFEEITSEDIQTLFADTEA